MTSQTGRCHSLTDLGAAVREARDAAGDSQTTAGDRATTAVLTVRT